MSKIKIGFSHCSNLYIPDFDYNATIRTSSRDKRDKTHQYIPGMKQLKYTFTNYTF